MRAALILLLIGGATAQQLPITGEVASRATGEPVAGATLRVSSYNQATTVADAAGHFSTSWFPPQSSF